MNSTSKFECEQTLLVQADFDGELDAAQAAALVRHREECAECRAVEEKLLRARTLLRAAPRFVSSSEFRERLSRTIDGAQRARGEAGPGTASPPRANMPLSPAARPADEMPSPAAARPADEMPSPAAARPADEMSSPAGAQPTGGASAGERAADVGPPSQWRSRPRAQRWSWRSSAGWAAAAAVALVAIILAFAPRSADIGAQLVNSHLRALQLDSHLVDVVSTDHHTVKPWFAGKVDFAPPVKQLDADGYVLKGGRVDVVDARTAAVLVYQAGRHTVEVFIWPARPESAITSGSQQLNGFNLRRWNENGFEIWCVSDMAAEELDTFVRRWRAAS